MTGLLVLLLGGWIPVGAQTLCEGRGMAPPVNGRPDTSRPNVTTVCPGIMTEACCCEWARTVKKPACANGGEPRA